MSNIPIQTLKHEEEHVFFACRTMQENHKQMKALKPVPHRHDFYTVLLVEKACGFHNIDYVQYKMTPGLVFFVGPGQVHQVIVNNDAPRGDILMFSDEFLTRSFINKDFITNLGLFSGDAGTPPIKVPAESFKSLLGFSAAIKEAFNDTSPYKFDVIAANLKLFLIECNKYAIKPNDENPQNLQAGRTILKEFRELLDSKYKEWHKVSEFAKQMHINPDYLNSVIKNNIGKTAKEMIFERIALEAKRLGLHTSLTSKEIAYELGYDDPSHFSKFFKKESGESFTTFRKKLEKQL